MKHTTSALEAAVHFFDEQRTEPYIRYGEGSSTVEKCAEAQEDSGSYAPHKSRLAGAKL